MHIRSYVRSNLPATPAAVARAIVCIRRKPDGGRVNCLPRALVWCGADVSLVIDTEVCLVISALPCCFRQAAPFMKEPSTYMENLEEGILVAASAASHRMSQLRTLQEWYFICVYAVIDMERL